MFSTIWNLIPTNIKVYLGIGLTSLILVVGGIYSYQAYQINSLESKLNVCSVKLEYSRLIYDGEMAKAKKTIEDQNASISQFKLDSVNYENAIKQKNNDLLEANIIKQEEIKVELIKDSSSDNQLKIISNMLKEFSSHE